jgi:hypothetical protein
MMVTSISVALDRHGKINTGFVMIDKEGISVECDISWLFFIPEQPQ